MLRFIVISAGSKLLKTPKVWLPRLVAPLCLLALLATGAARKARAGPAEFGLAEVRRAIAERGLKPNVIRFNTEITMEAPGSYRVLPYRISGGDLRGLMYGLLEAADQIRRLGHLVNTSGRPATPIRGIRRFVRNQQEEEEWYYSRDYWLEYFAMLARNRFNRFTLVFAHQDDHLASPYPFWVDLPEFPEVRVPGLSGEQRRRNLEMLRFISQTAADHAIDFTLGIWVHPPRTGQQSPVEGLTPGNIGPYTGAALRELLASCPNIRGVQLQADSASGIPGDQQLEFYSEWVFRALGEAGHRVTLDLRGDVTDPRIMETAAKSGIPLSVSAKYWAEHLGRPYQPAETCAGCSYANLLRKPRDYDLFWEIRTQGSHRLLLWGDPDYVRRIAPTLTLSGSQGFEVDAPIEKVNFGDSPGPSAVPAAEQADPPVWKHDFQQHWLFYRLWGRLSYDPKAPARIWMTEMQRRFGVAAPEVLAAYRSASGVLSEIVAAHMADPSTSVSPEVNPGGLIDAYMDVLPSSRRFIASIREALSDRIHGKASAKQTPVVTADLLDDASRRTSEAVELVREKLSAANREWNAIEPDFRVLALLARYHARKLLAAEQLVYFDETCDLAALDTAEVEVRSAIAIWEKLADFTEGLYPHQMAFGPGETGRWKDKLPYVRHDLKLVEERRKTFQAFGPFDLGFDFGGPAGEPRGEWYRNDPYVLRNTVAPRFESVGPNTAFSEETGYGWLSEGGRIASAIPAAPYEEVRAVSANPTLLPENVLLGDWVRGRDKQFFRARTGDGDFTVTLIHPDGTSTARELGAKNGWLDIDFPEGEWTFSGLVIKGTLAKPQQSFPQKELTVSKRPTFRHVKPRSAVAGRDLNLSLRITPVSAATTVRLHYRTLNQLADFKTLEEKAPRLTFTIPGEEISADWDLLYYFEVLNEQGTGWFAPDPLAATPYYVLETRPSPTTRPR